MEYKTPKGYNSLDVIPPDELLEVIDIHGNKGIAQPTWYPFKFESNPNREGKCKFDVVQCEPYWDGGWLIKCEGLESNIDDIIGWKLLNQN